MTGHRHTDRRGLADRSLLELVAIARSDLEDLEQQIRWRTSELDGQRTTGTAGSSTGPADPTGTAGSRQHVASALRRVKGQLGWLVDHKLPSMLATLELDSDDPRYSERPRESDPAAVGPSAYHGDRKLPRSRSDLQDALDAQHRRMQRGESHGDG